MLPPTAADLVMNSAQGFQSLLDATSTRPLATFDNRPTWDNPTPVFDNRPTWDDWGKKS